MKLRALLVGAALATTTAFSVHAGDLIVPPPPPLVAVAPPLVAAPPIYAAGPFWAGAYVGAKIGAGWENAVWQNPFDSLADHAEPVGFLGGGQIGYNFQFYPWMLGIEGDLIGTSLGDTRIDGAGFSYGVRTYWAATITGRLGYDYYGRLLYVKGGIAFSSSRNTMTDPSGNSVTVDPTARTGWTIGGGVEFPLYESWSAQVEYDYLDFASQNVTVIYPPRES